MANTMNELQALNTYFNSFSLTAYEENSVPTGTAKPNYPYLTYEVKFPSFGNEAVIALNYWNRTSTWQTALTFAETLKTSLKNGGKQLITDTGTIWLKQAEPFATYLGDSNDDMIKRVMFNITLENLQI